MIKRFFIIILFSFCVFGGNAQETQKEEYREFKPQKREAAFAPGERLVFAGSYGAALIPNIEAGEVVVKVTKTIVGGVPAINIYGNVKAYPSFRLVFDINDTYQTWIDSETLVPLKHSGRIREGTYRFNSDYLFDWNKMEVNTIYHNLKRPKARSKTMRLVPGSFDAIALFYNLRNQDISEYTINKPMTLELVLDDTIRTITYKYLGPEVRRIKRLGTFNTLKFSCAIATSSGESFRDGTELFLWLSDDRNKVPLYVETPIKIGSIRGYLIEYSGLKYPLDAKID